MGKVLSICSEMIFEDVYRRFNQELDLFLSYIPVVKRDSVRVEMDKILNIKTELPAKQTRAERFEESPEGKQYIEEHKNEVPGLPRNSDRSLVHTRKKSAKQVTF